MSKRNSQPRTVPVHQDSPPSRKAKKSSLRKRIVLFSLYAILLGYGAYQVCFVQQAQLRAMQQEQESLRAAIGQEEERNEALSEEYAAGNTQDVVERIAREKLGLVKPDEKMYVDKSRN